MIYDLEEKNTLKKIDSSHNKHHNRSFLSSVADNLITVLMNIFFLPLIIYTFIANIILYFRNYPSALEAQEIVDIKDQARYGFNYDRIHIDYDYQPESGSLSFQMNYHALKSFAHAIKVLFSDTEGSPRLYSMTGRLIDMKQEGYHTHSDFFYPYLPFEIEVGTASGRLEVIHAAYLYASPEIWRKISDVWMNVADGKIPKLIVLDRYQTEWCDPASKGRFIIEYLPDFIVQTANSKQPSRG